jgi:hypothetical protein
MTPRVAQIAVAGIACDGLAQQDFRLGELPRIVQRRGATE